MSGVAKRLKWHDSKPIQPPYFFRRDFPVPQFLPSNLVPYAFESERRSASVSAVRVAVAAVEDKNKRLLRTPNSSRDLILSALVVGWREKLKPWAGVNELCAHFPRVANRLALCWPDDVLTKMVLKELVTDRRGRRRGFPHPVRAELLALCKALGLKIEKSADSAGPRK